MLTVRFKIDTHQLAYYSYLKHTENQEVFPQWSDLQKSLEAQFESTAAYLFFQQKYIGYGLNWVGYPDTTVNHFVRDGKNVERIFDVIFESEIFKKILNETESDRAVVEKEWSDSGERALTQMRDITGLDADGEVTVFILHPKLATASFIGNRSIEWGTEEMYPGGHCIGLAHEILHFLTEDAADALFVEEYHWRLHALIHLATDQELRTRLYPDSGDYFKPEIIADYHARLIDTAKKLLPQWQEYLKKDSRNLLALFEEIR